MGRVLILDRDGPTGYLLAGTAKGASLKVEKAVRLPEGLLLPGANPGEAGRQFREFLKTVDVAAGSVVALVPRERLTLKEVRYPIPASANDEPALVRFQASRDLPEPSETFAIDFCPVSEPALAGGDRRSLVVMAKKEIVQQWQAFAEGAKLPLAGVLPRSIGQVASLERAIAAGSTPAAASFDAPIAVVCRGEGWGELAVGRAGRVAFSRPLGSAALQAVPGLANEMKRSFAAASGQFGGVPVSSAYLAEPHTAPVVNQVGALLPVTVHGFDPAVGLEGASAIPRGLLAGMAGTLVLAGASEFPVNLAAPREPKIERDKSKTRVAVLGGLLLLMGLGLAAYGVVTLQAKTARLKELTYQKTDLDSTLAIYEEDAKRARSLDDWMATNVNTLDEFYDTTDRFPDVRSTRMNEWSIGPLPQSTLAKKGAKNPYAVRLDMKLATENGKQIDLLAKEMDRDQYYRIDPPQLRGSSGAGSSQFNQAFELRADVVRRDPSQYSRYLKVKVPVPTNPPVKAGATASESPTTVGGT